MNESTLIEGINYGPLAAPVALQLRCVESTIPDIYSNTNDDHRDLNTLRRLP